MDTGPVKVSVGRFWSMVWEYGLHTIVMLTRCVEAGKVQVLVITPHCVTHPRASACIPPEQDNEVL